MEILADLIEIDRSGRLPLPWSVRAHLGLASNTGVSIFLTKPDFTLDKRGRKKWAGVPDILVTPLTPDKLHLTYSAEIRVKEKTGAVAEILAMLASKKPDANIVLSDTITLEGRSEHKLNLVIEPVDGESDNASFGAEIATILKEAGATLEKELSLVYDSLRGLKPYPPLRVGNAFIPWTEWRGIIEKEYGDVAAEYDLGKVVVSSNPDQRLLRFVFPKRGVIQLEVPHHNVPGALRQITDAIQTSGYNILSSRLSRTPRTPMTERMSIFVAVCELVKGAKTQAEEDQQKKDLLDRVKAIPDNYITTKARVVAAQRSGRTRYLLPRSASMVLPPDNLIEQIAAERLLAVEDFKARKLRAPKLLIFLSYRFVEGRVRRGVSKEGDLILDEHASSLRVIRAAISDMDCHALEAEPRWDLETTRDAIYPRLWAADSCLIFAMDERGEGTPSSSQSQEYGFFIGQSKQARFLVEQRRLGGTSTVGNLDGFIRTTYIHPSEGELPEDHDTYQSLYRQVQGTVEAFIERHNAND